MTIGMKDFLAAVAEPRDLSEAEARAAFDLLMEGEATAAQIGAFLMGLRMKGEAVSEIVGAARAMRARMLLVPAPEGTIDVCGTGGDGMKTLNISTAVSIVVAACGVAVAKHGNRAVSSTTGAADVMEALGLDLTTSAAADTKCLAEIGIAFLPAPRHHAATRHVAPVRKELGLRTIFNLLGPLSNPAAATRQLMGVFHRDWLFPLAKVHRRLGADHVWLVHGADGLDELTVTGPSYVSALKDGEISNFEIVPEDAGLSRHAPETLAGGDAAHNAAALRSLLDGATGGYRDIVLLNTAAALIVGGKVDTLRAGAAMAADAIDSGAAKALLARWIDFTKENA